MKRFLYAIACCLCFVTGAQAETILLDFSTNWCGACQQMTPVVAQLEQQGFCITKIDVDQNRDLAQKYQVSSIPCFVVVEDGKEIDRVVGTVSIDRLRVHLRREKIVVQDSTPVVAKGYYSAVVRVKCDLGGPQHALGSGVLVKWGGKVVVLTARHVVADAKKVVVVLTTGKQHNGKVLVTSVWDCAVIQLDGKVEGIKPADIISQNASEWTDKTTFEACGFGGPETKLACNRGRFIGFKRSMETRDGRDDWFEISGTVRQGDSGGPIFTQDGKVAGILWGTDGKVVVGVQAGRVGMVLNESLKSYQQQAFTQPPMTFVALKRNPSPMPQQPCDPSTGCCPQDEPIVVDQTELPWRKGVDSKINGINSKLDAILQAQQQPAQVTPPQAPPEQPKDDAKNGNALEQKIDEALHKLPQTNLVKTEEKQLESKSGLQRLWGAICSIDLSIILVLGAVVGAVLLGHKLYTTLHAHKTQIDAALAKVPVIGSQLQAGFDKVDNFNTNTVDPKIQAALNKGQADIAAVQAKADSALHVATQAAVATTPPAAIAATVATAVKAAASPT
jgi:thioredoxin 1